MCLDYFCKYLNFYNIFILNLQKLMLRILLILLFCGAIQLHAQFNVSIGYGLGYTPGEVNNQIISDFNKVFRDSTYLGDPMSELHYMHGLIVGARWKFENFSFELNWESLGRTREALGEDENDVVFNKRIYYTVNNYSAGLESHFGNFGLGIAAGVRSFQVKERIGNTNNKVSFLTDQQYFIKPFLSINLLGGQYVGLSIKPYISIPFGSLNLKNLATELSTSDNPISAPTEQERLWIGGISFIFYNGVQSF